MNIVKQAEKTETAVDALAKLIEKLNENVRKDISETDSFGFRCHHKTIVDGEGVRAYWKIKSNGIVLRGQKANSPRIFIGDIISMDFSGCLAALENVIELYNNKSGIKDKEIEKFLAICEYLTKA